MRRKGRGMFKKILKVQVAVNRKQKCSVSETDKK